MLNVTLTLVILAIMLFLSFSFAFLVYRKRKSISCGQCRKVKGQYVAVRAVYNHDSESDGIVMLDNETRMGSDPQHQTEVYA